MPKPITTEQRRLYKQREKDKDPDRYNALHAARCKRYRERHPEKATKINKEWRVRNKEKQKAHQAVSNALKRGRLVRQACWCGNVKSQAHHPDYSKKLEVVWLCQKHHKELHRKNPSLPS